MSPNPTVSERFFSLMHRLATRHTRLVIAVSLLLAMVGGYIYFFQLQIVSDRTQLVNKELRANQSHQKYLQAFGDDTYLVLVVRIAREKDGLPSLPTAIQRAKMKRLADGWVAQLHSRPKLFPKVINRIDWSGAPDLALLYMPKADMLELADAAREIIPDLKRWSNSPSLSELLSILNEKMSLRNGSIGSARLALLIPQLEKFLQFVERNLKRAGTAIENPPKITDLAASLMPAKFDPDGYFFSTDGRILTVFATVIGNASARNQYAAPVEFAQEALNTAAADSSLQDLTAGLAGMPALEYEEMKTSEKDFARTTVFALVCVTFLFALAFGGVIRPALAAMCLGISIGITFAFVWLIFGHLNLLAMVFTIILVALGIDFAIHFLTHYEQALSAGEPPISALRQTYTTVGGALLMGGITTSVAFFSAYFADFTGLVELGIIAGIGLIVCLVVMLVVYPAMLFIVDVRYSSRKAARPGRPLNRFFSRSANLMRSGHRKPVLLFISFLLVTTGYLFGQYNFDTNLLNLQAIDGNISRWQKLLFDIDDRSTFAISTFSNRAALEKTRKAFDTRPALVRRTESAFPAAEAEKREIIAGLRQRFSALTLGSNGNASLFKVKRQIWNMRSTIRKLRGANDAAKVALAKLGGNLDSLYRNLNSLPAKIAEERLSQINNRLRTGFQHALEEIVNLLDPAEFALDRLPVVFKERFVGEDSSLALLIYPAKNTWDRKNLDEFVEQARTIDANIFGEIIALYENGRSLIRSFLQTAIYALAAIAVITVMWFRSFRSTLLALTPLLTSVGLLVGFMKWGPWPISWNFANFFAIPILIGIGVDSGIHLVRAWQDHRDETFQSAVKAVFFSSATTMIGFGLLATSNHAGIASLGYILFVGISLSLIAALTILPIALTLTDAKT